MLENENPTRRLLKNGPYSQDLPLEESVSGAIKHVIALWRDFMARAGTPLALSESVPNLSVKLSEDYCTADIEEEEAYYGEEDDQYGDGEGKRIDFTKLELKPDHTNRPLWACEDGRIFLETFSPLYKHASDFLTAIGEPFCRLESLHEYNLTPQSLYVAVSVGLETKTIISVLKKLAKTNLPKEMGDFIHASTANYGKHLVLVPSELVWRTLHKEESIVNLIVGADPTIGLRRENEKIFPTSVDWRASAPRDEMPIAGSYSAADITLLNTDRAPFQRLPENLLCLVGLSQNYYLGDDVYPMFLYDDDRVEMDLFSLIRNPNPFKTWRIQLWPPDPQGHLLLSRGRRWTSTMKTTPSLAEGARAEEHVQEGLAHEIPPVETATTTKVVQEAVHEEEVAATEPPVNKRRKQMRRKRVNEEAEANAPPKVLRKDHASGPAHSTHGGKSLAAMGLDAGFTFSPLAAQNTPTAVSDPKPLSYTKPQPHPVSSKGAAAEIPTEDVATTEVNVRLSMRSLNLGKSTFPSVGGSSRGIYQSGWGMTNNCRLDSPKACQDKVDHIVLPEYFSELRHLHNTEFLSQYNMNLARQVAMGSQLRLRFEQEVRLLKKATAKIARRDQKIQAREEEIKKLDEEIRSLRTVETEVHGLRNRTQNLETLLEAEVSTLQAQVTGEERIKAAFEEFKKSEDEKVEQRCAEMDARLDALSIDFDEELYPHMLTAIAGRRWVIGHGLCLAIIKCEESTDLRQAFVDVVSARIMKGISEGLKYRLEHGEAKLDLAAIKAYDPEAEMKYIAALTALRDLKYPLVDQLEKLRDAPIDLLMASLHLERDSGEDAPEWIRKLRPSTSQLKIPIYPEKQFREEGKCRVVCRTHRVGSAHHARSDGIPVSVPTVAPQGLAILLADAAIQTEAFEDEASPRLLRSKSLPPMYNLD
ncbi:gypsy type transposase [Tanacetum coccineum]